ncbi:hypothetical protein [Catellatospora methionotrophica]|uniref:HNH endonuclease n=1 Tax=Catellatospora methionotrophica TaxID=121620 RepID=UPI0033F4CF5B
MHVHHVGNLAELGPSGPGQPTWAAVMARRKRKAPVVCETCHDHIHVGQPNPILTA